MTERDLLGKIVERIQDARYLFVIAIVLLAGSAALLGNVVVAIIAVVGAFLLVALITWLDHVAARRNELGVWIALRFPPDTDPSKIRLTRCSYSVVDPRKPDGTRTGTLRPVRNGSGWICPVPNGARSEDVIDFRIEDEQGGTWLIQAYVPQLSWPQVDVMRSD